MAVSEAAQFARYRRFASAPQHQRRAISFALYANMLRQQQTTSELKMWELLVKSCPEFRFRRQWPLFDRIADFYCRELRLVIEVDGKSHQTERARRRDAEANQTYQENRCNVLRVQNWHLTFIPDRVELIVRAFIHVLCHSDESTRKDRCHRLVVSFREEPDSFRLISSE